MNPRRRIAAAPAIVLGLLCALDKPAMAQNLRELARAHAAESPGVVLEIAGPPGEYPPKGIEELAAESDVVLRARLVRIATYLWRNDNRILTDYRMDPEQLIAGSLPSLATRAPGNTPPLRLTVFGGELRVEGVLVRARDWNRDEIVDGRPYLLFLMRSRSGDTGSYEINEGGIFEVSVDRVRPLLRDGASVFKGADALTPDDFVRKVKSARREPP